MLNIFGNKYPYVTSPKIDTLENSLMLISVKDLRLVKSKNNKGKDKIKATFTYNGVINENVSVTDPLCYTIAEDKEIPKAILVISLPENPFNEDKYYKFIAKVFPQA